MSSDYRIYIREVGPKKTIVVTVNENAMVGVVAQRIFRSPDQILTYKNRVLDNTHTFKYYNIPKDSLLYIGHVKQRSIPLESLPQFAELDQNGTLIIPFIEELINNNAEILESIQRGERPNFHISIRTNRNGSNPTQQFRIETTFHSNVVHPTTQSAQNVLQNRTNLIRQSNTISSSNQGNQNIPNPHTNRSNTGSRPTPVDLQSRRVLENLLNTPQFRGIIQRSAGTTIEPQYNTDYNAAMLFIQSWLNVSSQSFSRMAVLFSSIYNLLNNPRIVLSQETFRNVTGVMRAMSRFLNESAQVMENEFVERGNQSARKCGGERDVSVDSQDDDVMWRAFEETLEEHERQNEEQIMNAALQEATQSDSYHIQYNGSDHLIDYNTSLDEINSIIDQLTK
ncbi:hypothetical protein EIN_373330 [Entamoeba invadens IP1]|uniref:Ubiquitin-like domain-containing protein n=2 Tax=Entamoeba invadens TaxID=33085 RepID=A0A0A1TVT2_ENTIV|nr:hypothetical protein EIN_373330 [Entamoeba invadens IP1]ELP83388.1 hypothetical protein EIN_373330 [Entamoeba invadens IP1]BAN41561.1 hypothetical protein [Entamoeba invadens]|eukprot:XP_004182734.1 hypothetical protein EIN_373330 [Entamoeba invadens IP1]